MTNFPERYHPPPNPEYLDFTQLPEFDKNRYHDPEYLSWCRWQANMYVLASRQTPSFGKVVDWVSEMGTDYNGEHQGILFGEEVDLIEEHGLQYPKPWTSERAKIDIPRKFDSILGLHSVTIPDLASRGVVCGLTGLSGDIFHAGYALFLRECRNECDYLVVGVDDNYLSQRNRESSRPFNDFPVRTGTLSGCKEIDALYPIRKEMLKSAIDNPSFPYYLLLYNPLNKGGKFILNNTRLVREIAERADPKWYQYIGPQLRIFWTEGDRAAELKQATADCFGGKGIEFHKFTKTISSTAIGRHFGVVKRPNQANVFGVAPYWRRGYDRLTQP